MATRSPIAHPIPFLRASITKASLILLVLGTTTMTSCTGLLLQGKKVLVTGGGRGIGRAIALICHDHGAKVIVTSRTQSELEETLSLAARADEGREIADGTQARLTQSTTAAKLLARRGTAGGRRSASPGKVTSVGARRTGSASKARMGRSSVSQLVDAIATGSSTVATSTSRDAAPDRMSYFVCDVTDESQVESTIQSILKREGTIDIVINNAGGSQLSKGPVGTLPSPDLESLLKLNVVGPNLVTAAVCKHAEGWKADDTDKPTDSSSQKVILNISSKAGKVGLENYSFYVATKFALEGLTSSWAKELHPRNIRVHSLSPGMVNTQSFPKPEGKKGVREASSIEDVLLLILTGRRPNDNNDDDASTATTIVENMMDYTGHYIHADEYDRVVDKKGVSEGHLAFKRIDEDAFRV